jgi:hypothetical protein
MLDNLELVIHSKLSFSYYVTFFIALFVAYCLIIVVIIFSLHKFASLY